jgi:hypothetical protein
MSRSTLFTALGGVTLAFTLAGGVGWVAAQPAARPTPGGEQPSPVAARPPAEPPAKKPDAPADAGAERIKKLEKWADTLRAEIGAQEKQIELLTKARGDGDRVAQRRKQRDEVEEEYRRLCRELDRLEAEAAVLKKLSEDDTGPEPQPALVEEEVNRDPSVKASATERNRLRDEFRRAAQLTPGESPLIAELKKKVAAAEKRHADIVSEVRARVVVLLRQKEKAAVRQRLAELATAILIKKELRDRLKVELQAAQKLAATDPPGSADLEGLRKSLEPLREVHARVQRELLLARLAREGVVLPEERFTDSKLDQILRELAALRKEVRDLKSKK